MVLSGLALVAGCAQVRYERSDLVTPIPSHPPITTSGVVGSYDPGESLLTFEDGRVVRITEGTRVAPAVGGLMRLGEQVIVDAAMPVGVAWPGNLPVSKFK